MPRRSRSSLIGRSLVLVAERRSGPAQHLVGGLHGATQMVSDRRHAEPVDVTQHQRRPIRRAETRQHHPGQAGIDRRPLLDRAGLLRPNGPAPGCDLVAPGPANDRPACDGPRRSATPHPPPHQRRHARHQPRTRPGSAPPPSPGHLPGWPDTNRHQSRCACTHRRTRTGSSTGTVTAAILRITTYIVPHFAFLPVTTKLFRRNLSVPASPERLSSTSRRLRCR